jgi:hypothetical protein
LPYTVEAIYTPDWTIGEDIIIEGKGYFRYIDQRKMKAVRRQYPDKRIIIVFQYPDRKIAKNSKTTYKEWALKNGFEVLTLEELNAKQFK